VHDREGGRTWCSGCGELLIERDWYELDEWNFEGGQCRSCGYQIAGVFEEEYGDWGRRRLPVKIATFA
jgi:pyruvate formate lyase activating enzyme